MSYPDFNPKAPPPEPEPPPTKGEKAAKSLIGLVSLAAWAVILTAMGMVFLGVVWAALFFVMKILELFQGGA